MLLSLAIRGLRIRYKIYKYFQEFPRSQNSLMSSVYHQIIRPNFESLVNQSSLTCPFQVVKVPEKLYLKFKSCFICVAFLSQRSARIGLFRKSSYESLTPSSSSVRYFQPSFSLVFCRFSAPKGVPWHLPSLRGGSLRRCAYGK